MADLFVSYSRLDAEFVRALVESIEERGKRVWVDTEGIADGELFPQAIRTAIERSDSFVFVIGEYNFGPQPGLKNLTDHFLEEWYWRPAAVVSYSPGRLAGARASSAWHPILSEMGMIVTSSTVAVGPIAATFDANGAPIGEPGRLTKHAFARDLRQADRCS